MNPHCLMRQTTHDWTRGLTPKNWQGMMRGLTPKNWQGMMRGLTLT